MPTRRSTLPSWHRDQLTGAPLEQGTVRRPWRDSDGRRPKEFDTKAQRIIREPIPYAIHSHQEERSGTVGTVLDRLGSPRFSGPFLRYMGKATLPTPVQQRRERWANWHQIPGIWDWLAGRLAADWRRFGAVTDLLDSVRLALEPDADLLILAQPFGRSGYWLGERAKQCAHLARSEFLLRGTE